MHWHYITPFPACYIHPYSFIKTWLPLRSLLYKDMASPQISAIASSWDELCLINSSVVGCPVYNLVCKTLEKLQTFQCSLV